MKPLILYSIMFLLILSIPIVNGQGSVVSLTVTSADLAGNPINGMWTELLSSDGSKTLATGFTPVTFNVNSNTQYTVFVSDWQNIVFHHWEDGSTNRYRPIIPTQDVTLTAFYSTGGTTNQPPVAVNDSVTASQNTPITINVLANDSDPDNDPLTVASVTRPSGGTAVINADNTITYTPKQNFFGSDSFDYTISDGRGGTDIATVFVTVNSSSGTSLSITRVKSGLVASDPLNNATLTKEQLQSDTRYWTYGGSAAESFNPPAPFDFFQNSTGRYIGVQAPASGTYVGYYAVTPPTNALFFHAVLTTPVRTIPNDLFFNGLYVQTANGKINYVACVSSTSAEGTTWHIVRANGNFFDAKRFETLWSDTSPNQPLTRDCTIITNGNNYLKVYLDNVMVYENNRLQLHMSAPFLYFLEPQNSHTTMLYGIYKDFYISSDENIMVINAPISAARVDIVDTAGKVLASAPVLSGSATIDIGKYHFPLAANINIYDSSNSVIASTSSTSNIFGGDVYSVS